MTTQHGLSSPAMKDDNEEEREVEVEVEVDIEQDDVRAADSIIGEIQTGTPSPPATQLVTRPRKRHKREQCCINWGCTLPDRHAGLCNHVNDDTPRGYFPVKPSDILAGRRVRVLWRKCSKEYDGFIGEVQQILLHDGRPGARFRVNDDDGDSRWHMSNADDIFMKLINSDPRTFAGSTTAGEDVDAKPAEQVSAAREKANDLELVRSTANATGFLGT